MTLRSALVIAGLFAAGVLGTIIVAISAPSGMTPISMPAREHDATTTQPGTATSTQISPVRTATSSEPSAPPRSQVPAPKQSTKSVAPITAPVATPSPKVAEPTPEKPRVIEPQPPAIIVVASTSSSTASSPPTSTGLALESAQIFMLGNQERVNAGLLPLSYNVKLAAMADAKNADMIAEQYFAHVSPAGVGIGDLADRFRYVYRHVGENLALGDFTSSAHVIKGWMDSPGHRANILNPKFTEIGISAVRGSYQGREVWYAVQEFGTPLPDCPWPEESLRKEIETLEPQTAEISVTLATLKAEIAAAEDPAIYNKKADEYNALVELYNTLIAKEKVLINSYNAEVEAYNVCIGV